MLFSRVTERKGKILIAYRDMLAGVVSSGSAPRVYCEVSIAIRILSFLSVTLKKNIRNCSNLI